MPIAAGIITTDFQTPLSHISLLSFNRATPLMTHKEAWDDKTFNSLLNKKVRLKVCIDTFFLTPIDELSNKSKKEITRNLSLDLSIKKLIDKNDLNSNMVSSVGGKAANFGSLIKIFGPKNESNISTPNGAFAIPFHYYYQHINNNNVTVLIKTACKKLYKN